MISHGKYDAAMKTYIIALSPRCNISFNCLCKEIRYNFNEKITQIHILLNNELNKTMTAVIHALYAYSD
jgi:hypothetical protein